MAKYLKHISLTNHPRYEKGTKLHRECLPIAQMLATALPEIDAGGIGKITIQAVPHDDPSFTEYRNRTLDILLDHAQFDYATYFKCEDTRDRQEIALDFLSNRLQSIARDLDIDPQAFADAASTARGMLGRRLLWPRLPVPNPSGGLIAQVEYGLKGDSLVGWLVLESSAGDLLGKSKLFTLDANELDLTTVFGSLEWESDTVTRLSAEDASRSWRMDVEEYVPERSSRATRASTRRYLEALQQVRDREEEDDKQ